MLSRREFARNCALLAAGTVTLDQLEVLDRMAPRSLFAAWPSMPTLYGDGRNDDTEGVEAVLLGQPAFDARSERLATPFQLGRGHFRVMRRVRASHRARISGATDFAGAYPTEGWLANSGAHGPIDWLVDPDAPASLISLAEPAKVVTRPSPGGKPTYTPTLVVAARISMGSLPVTGLSSLDESWHAMILPSGGSIA